ncbi:unnamed protein product [Diabrotica balteata]|uniref:Uncharacterized protein n=1 Tax=Diabrotica balteata TaxID=107213 RepID=A0A9N9T8L7_DIABA|nr:unnamed protein product [Diabrotica balteata]
MPLMMIIVLQGGSARRRRKHLISTRQITGLADAVLQQSLPPLAAAVIQRVPLGIKIKPSKAIFQKRIRNYFPFIFALCFLGDSDSLQEDVCAKETMEDVESVDSSGKNGAACKCEKQQQINEDDYSIARRKCQKAEETSDLNSSDNRPRRRRPPTKFATTSSSSDSESAIGHKNKTIQSNLPKKDQKLFPIYILTLCFLGDSDSLQEDVCAKETMEDVESEYLKHILRKLNMLQLIVTDLRAEVSNLSKISTSFPRELQEELTILNIWENFSLPLDSEEEFANFEDFFKCSEKNFESVSSILILIQNLVYS